MKTKTVYVANDGKEFDNQADCKAWESTSALRQCVFNTRTTFLVLQRGGFGSSDFINQIVSDLNERFIFAERNGQSQHTCDNNR